MTKVPPMEPAERTITYHAWLDRIQRDVQDEYDRLHAEAQARTDIQHTGHGGEATWIRILNEWLPRGYEAVPRKYIVPEERNVSFETDIVVFRPSYPHALRSYSDVLPSGVAAAFSVKLTLDASGLKDGIERAAKIRRALKPRYGTARAEMVPPFPVGLLAHSHAWKAAGSTPTANVDGHLASTMKNMIGHPRELLDLLCVADLGTWVATRVPYLPPNLVEGEDVPEPLMTNGCAVSSFTRTDEASQRSAVAILLANLSRQLSFSDPSLKPVDDALRVTGATGNMGSDSTAYWPLESIYSDFVAEQIRTRSGPSGWDRFSADWGTWY